jgi:hypothetical protein
MGGKIGKTSFSLLCIAQSEIVPFCSDLHAPPKEPLPSKVQAISNFTMKNKLELISKGSNPNPRIANSLFSNFLILMLRQTSKDIPIS